MYQLTEQDIREAYQSFQEWTEEYYEARTELLNAEEDLERKRLAGLASGEIEGRNSDAREAAARELLAEGYERVRAAKQWVEETRGQYDKAELEVKMIDKVLRLMAYESDNGQYELEEAYV